ncbi:MAG: YqaE/Pmp3 family membrane protein [Bacteroidota bacterium]
MKQFKLMAVVLLGTFILGACSTSNEVVGGGIFHKRKYTGGVYVDRAEKQKVNKEQQEELNYDILSVEQEKQSKYVSSQIIREESRSQELKPVMAFDEEKSGSIDEKVKKCAVADVAMTEEVEFDIYRNSSAKARKFNSQQEIRVSNKVAAIEEVYGNDQTFAALDSDEVPTSSSAIIKEDKDAVVVTTDVKKKNAVKMSNKSMGASAPTIVLIILAILLPPLAVGIYEGITTRFWISLLLTLLFWLPGVIYAILVVTGTI